MHGGSPAARCPRDPTLRALFVESMAADLAGLGAPGTVADAGDGLALIMAGTAIGTVPDDTPPGSIAAFLAIAQRLLAPGIHRSS